MRIQRFDGGRRLSPAELVGTAPIRRRRGKACRRWRGGRSQ
ncbi:MAG: hypothetical protein U0703_29085 [Anaerolineae bacterium]